MAPPGRRNKQKLGRQIRQGDRRLVNSISQGIVAEAVRGGAEAAPAQPADAAPAARAEKFSVQQAVSVQEARAVQEGARTLFDIAEDGFVAALAIMLVPRVLKQGSRRIAAVAAPFGFVCRISSRERLAVVAPAGYVTDFASIPRAFHFIISPFGKHAEAAVIHDWLYTLGTPKDRKGRRVADKAFVRALKLLEVSWFTRVIMYWAVRLGGAGGYGLADDFAFRSLEDLERARPAARARAVHDELRPHTTPEGSARKSRMAAKADSDRNPARASSPASAADHGVLGFLPVKQPGEFLTRAGFDIAACRSRPQPRSASSWLMIPHTRGRRSARGRRPSAGPAGTARRRRRRCRSAAR